MTIHGSSTRIKALAARWRAAALTTAGLAMLVSARALAPGAAVSAEPCMQLAPGPSAPTLRLLTHSVDPMGWSHGRLLAGSDGACLAVATRSTRPPALARARCAGSDPGQQWQWKVKWIDGDDGGTSVVLLHPRTASVLESDAGTLLLAGFQPDNPRQRFRLTTCLS